MLKHAVIAVTAALVCGTALAGPAAHWTLTGIPAAKLPAVERDVGGLTGNGPDLARAIVAALRAQGYIGAHATVYPVTHRIVVTLGPTARQGAYADYLPGGTLSTKSLNTALPLAEAAATANNQALHVKIGQNTAHAVGTPSDASIGFGGIALTSYGPRFAGSDTASIFGYGHAYGFDASASVTSGLPSWTPKESFGGKYLAENLDLSRPTPWGIFSWKTTHTYFLAGGAARALDLTGDIWQIQVQDKYPLSQGLWVRGGLAYAYDQNMLKSLDWETHQSNSSVFGGIAARGNIPMVGGIYHIRASVWQGVGGHQWEKGPSVMGTMSQTYTVARARVSLRKEFAIGNFPLYSHAILGVQYGSMGTPQIEQVYVGGQHRGSSFYTGAYAGNSGLWYDLNVHAKYYKIPATGGVFRLTPYATVNGGQVQQAGITTHIASAGAGVNTRITRHVFAQVGYNWTLQAPPGTKQRGMLGFDLVGTF